MKAIGDRITKAIGDTFLEPDFARMAPQQSHVGQAYANLIGDLYSRWTLDGLDEIAYGVAIDFVSRPHMYVNDAIPDLIVNLRMEYGTAASFPNAAQRTSLLTPVFGKSDAQKPDPASAATPFQAARAVFFTAITAFTERAQNAPAPPLAERVRSSLVPLRAHFEKLRGRAVALSGGQIVSCFSAAVEILKSGGVATVFGQDQPEHTWPFGASNPLGAKLVEAIGTALPIANELKFTSTRFVLLQRLANTGAASIKAVLTEDASTQPGFDAISTSGYAWASAYRDFQQG